MRASALLVALAAWAVPGLGHVVLGRRDKAAWFGALILGTLAVGLWLGEGASISSVRFPIHFYGQLGAGLPAIVVDRTLGVVPQGRTIDRLELGVVFATVAGILNVIALVDAYELARRRPEGSA